MNIFKVLFVFSGLNLKVLLTDLCVNTLSSKFPQIITNFTEDIELAFIERLEMLYLIMILLIVLLSHILNESNSNFVVKFSYGCS